MMAGPLSVPDQSQAWVPLGQMAMVPPVPGVAVGIAGPELQALVGMDSKLLYSVTQGSAWPWGLWGLPTSSAPAAADTLAGGAFS